MRKLIPLLLLSLLFTSISPAQLRIALAGGAHTAMVNETNNLPGWSELKNKYTSRTGAHFGFIADLQVGYNSNFWFQPGIMYYNKGRKFANTYDTSQFEYSRISASQFINYIEFPLNIVYKKPVGANSKFFIGAGPYLSFLYNGLERTETFMKTGDLVIEENTDLPAGDAPGKYKTLDLGLNGTIGIEFGKVFVSANFSRGITDFYTATYDGSFKHQVIGGTLGIFLGKPVPLDPPVSDRDNDGVDDALDLCPDEPGSAAAHGCPDTDADGIADKQDKCPGQKGVLKYEGCPVPDTDGDGVNDEEDKCKDIPGLKKYNGCPVPDTDKDGINDEEDKCKDVPGTARYEGCPVPDRDGDGINDENDKCPDAAGKAANGGCPEVSREIEEKVKFAATRIQFKFAKSELLPESKTVLDEVAELMIKNPELKLEIQGHTSDDGSFAANMDLSEERAAVVKDYLQAKGVDLSRMMAKGYGPTRPLNEAKTPEEKAKNRRVELKPFIN